MHLLDWVAVIVGSGLIASGVRAIRRREAKVPEQYLGAGAVRLGGSGLRWAPSSLPR